ncbi:MAG: aromatic ring-hydroxylating dioxygenase subunit alpha [Gammaproteobacteria bacterium]|nr:aromatic ring-hydroxylating dioxygenase subunit alpha [Gammaproteobacteria bacterium]MCP4277547.1 aromatic ring-hydroxylating dioxygenase subunit alpha [Gammaproteobacteria bacterium]
MFINFWYPIIRSEDLSTKSPEKVMVLGTNLVAFRSQAGQAHVLSDTCVHRGASLGGPWSAGEHTPRIVNDCIVCPYHGWEFDGEGHCQNIPSVGYGNKVNARAKVDSYPVQEKYGIIFAFLGDLPAEERPPLLDIEEYEQEGWRANQVLVLDVDYYYERSIENALDPAHNEFVHPSHGFTAINRDTYRVNDYKTEDNQQGWGMWFMHKFNAPPLNPKVWEEIRTESGALWAGGGTYGPNTVITHINIQPTAGFRQYFFEQPISENKTRIFFLNMRNIMLNTKHDGPIHARNKAIAKQDIDILEALHPTLTPISNTKEVLMPADKAVIAYRKWLNKFDEAGWRINLKEFRRIHGKDKAFAIPCPARKNSKNWVIEAIPLVKKRTRNKLSKAS